MTIYFLCSDVQLIIGSFHKLSLVCKVIVTSFLLNVTAVMIENAFHVHVTLVEMKCLFNIHVQCTMDF